MKRLCLLIAVLILLGLLRQPTYVVPTARAQGPDNLEEALDIAHRFLREHHESYSLKPDLTDLKLLQVVPSLGADHVRFQQTYQGLLVYGAYVSVHIDKARENVPQVTSRYIPGIQVATTKAQLTEEAATEVAKKAVGINGPLRGDITSELLIYPKDDEYLLAWQVRIPASKPLGDWEVFVNALDGTVLDQFNRIRIEGPPPPGDLEKGKADFKIQEPAHMIRHYFGPSKVGPTDTPKLDEDREVGALSWTEIWYDGFEGAFPGPWDVFDNDGTTNGEYYWDDDPYRPHTGGWEAWPANGGANALTPPTNYPNYADSWMVYGPFDLSDAVDAELVFYYWSITESSFDDFFWGASIDGANFYGTSISGDYSDGPESNNFYLENFDLTNVYILGDLTGQPQVWIAFVFQSDYSVTYEGTYVDDVTIRKDDGSCSGDPNTGYVFNPNPVVTSGDTSLEDNNNADSATLTAQRQLVNLLGLDGSGQLIGPYADLTAPGITGGYKSAGQANEPGCLYYDYTRSDDRFEEVMAYYHIDSAQRYIQSLGFDNVNNRAIPVHAHYYAQDQSFYSPSPGDRGLHFGDGGVDDGEDADIILHEYGHAIQDNQVPGWGATNEGGAMGEGFGDYFPASVYASVNGGFNRECIGDWDATSYSGDNPPCLRRMDSDKHYPEDMENEEHADGEIWAAALWDMWLAVGQREVADALIIESHFYLNTMSQFADGANAILSADQNLYGGSHHAAICNAFTSRGILDQCESINLAVTPPGWDDIGSVLSRPELGYPWVQIEVTDLGNYNLLSQYDVVFINCAPNIQSTPQVADALRQYVQNGGSLYVSDWGYEYIQDAFPGYINFPTSPRIGNAQWVEADIVDSGLATYINPSSPPSTIDLEYDLSYWVVIDSVGADSTVHLRGSFSTSSLSLAQISPVERRQFGAQRELETSGQWTNKPLAVSFWPYGSSGGKVIYTTFHNEAQQTNLEKKLLEYLVLIPITSAQQQAVAQAIAAENLDLMRTDINTIDPGVPSPSYIYSHSRGVTDPRLAFALAWPGSTLKLSVYRPNGSLYKQTQSNQSPIKIVVPNAENGRWKYRVTGIDIPSNNYPYAVGIGAQRVEKVYLPLIVKRW